jgi:hypothetical protein
MEAHQVTLKISPGIHHGTVEVHLGAAEAHHGAMEAQHGTIEANFTRQLLKT